MRTFLPGLILGLAIGLLAQFLISSDDGGSARGTRRNDDTAQTDGDRKELDELQRQRDLIARLQSELEALRNRPDPSELPMFEVPTTEEGIALLEREFDATQDLDRLLALLEALLLQGEAGYPRLTRLLVKMAMEAMAGRIKEDDAIERVVPAFRMLLRHERKVVDYIGYLIASEHAPKMMRGPALGAAMFLAMNGVKGSEEFGPKLLESFLAASENGQENGMFASEQGRMLIEAMGMLKQAEAVDPLLRMLNDPAQQRQSYRVIEALGKIGDPRAVGPLIQRLKSNKNPNQWWSPEVRALARIGTPEATAAAEGHIRSIENDDHFFSQAGGYIRERPSAEVIAVMTERFRKNPDVNNVWGALRGLREANTPEAIALLTEMSTNASRGHVRKQAQQHLDHIKEMQQGVQEGLAAGED